MPSWRPPTASDPDGDDEGQYAPLSDRDADLAAALLDRYARVWLSGAGLPLERLAEVPDTVELVEGRESLRLRSWYTGSTYWLHGWDGARETAEEWMDMVADLQARNVVDERTDYGPTPWDDPSRWDAPPQKYESPPATYEGIVESGDPGPSPGFQIEVMTFGTAPAEAAAPPAAPAEPVDCHCGAALLDPAMWHGRGIVRCGHCGARWGVDVTDAETWSLWSLEGPPPQ